MAFLIHNKAFTPDKSLSYELNHIFDKLIENCSVHKHIIVVPTRKIVRNLKKYLSRQYSSKHNKAINNLYLFNLEDFFINLYDWLAIGKDKSIISEGIKLMLVEQSINQSDLQYYKFQDNYLKLDVARKISSIINGLRMDGVRPQSIQNEYLVFDERKSQDIELIHHHYQQLLGDSLLDRPQLMIELLDFLSELPNIEKLSNYLLETKKVESIHLIGFSDFRKLELQILSQFQHLTLPFIINLDYSQLAGPLFGNFQKILKYFTELNFQLFSTEPIYLDDERLNNKLSYHLFDEKIDKKFTYLTDNLTIIECQNVNDEIRYITKLVKYFNQVEQIPLSQIAIVARKPEDYAGLFFNSFKSENIPVNITHRKNIKQSVIVRNILLIFKLIEGNFTYDQLKLLFESKYIHLENIDKDNFLNVIRIIKLRNNNLSFDNEFIRNRAESFLNYIKLSLDSNLDKYERKDKENLKIKLEKFLVDIVNLKAKFIKFDKKFEILSLKSYYLNILKEFGIILNLVKQIEQIQRNKEKYNINEYNDLLEAIEAENDALEVFTNLIDNLVETLPLLGIYSLNVNDLLDRLEIASINEKYQIGEKENFGVTVTSIDQIRLIPFRIKILCGAIDGTLPLTYNVEKFLGKELIDAKYEHYRAEKVLFYQFLEDVSWQSYKSQKYITYPKMNNSSLNSISPLLDSLIRNTDLKESGKIINSIDDNDLLPINRAIISNTEYFKYLNNYQISAEQTSQLDLTDIYDLVQQNVIPTNIATKIHINKSHKDILSEKQYSISDFESYAQCPYYYYLKRLLKIDLTKEKEIKLEPIEVGSILHKILYEFYTQLQNEIHNNNNLFKPVKLEISQKPYYSTKLLEIIRKELGNPVYDHPFVKLHTNKLLSNQVTTNPLLRWLDTEIQNQNTNNLSPAFFEYPISVVVNSAINPEDRIAFTIKIDRIDIDIQTNSIVNFSVVDYKIRSNNIRDKDIIEFKSFQIPVYMISTIENFRTKNIEFKPINGTYYNLFDYKKNMRKVLDTEAKKNPVDVDELISATKEKTFEIKKQIINGFFEITKDERDCRYCDMEAICRKKTANQ